MNRKTPSPWLLLFLIFAAGIQTLQAAEGTRLRRYALFVGANDGGNGRVYLQYAESDALAMADVMRNIGGVSPSDSRVLLNPESEDLEESLASMARMAASGKDEASRVEFLLYYSGHSDEYGLLLKGQSYPYQKLKEAINRVTADVHIAILDSCSSGSFTRLKGGQRQRPFLMDESVDTSGYAFLTSSSENEAAQESDEIEGSFFTHFLLTGLMGAADHTKNGQVSLNEAYSYASEQTLARTEQTLAGAQHPSYDMKLSGSGDLVLTDLHAATAGLFLPVDISGRLFIRDQSGKLIAEINKTGEDSFTIALPPGYYTVMLENQGTIARSSLSIGFQQTQKLMPGQFVPEERMATTSRGNAVPAEEEPLPVVPYHIGIFSQSGEPFLVDGISVGFIDSVYAVKGVQAGFITELSGYLDGIQASYLFGTIAGNMDGIQVSGVFNTLEGTEQQGIQITGVFNTCAAPLDGVQVSGVFNTVEGWMDGLQVAGVFNTQSGGDVEGLQISGVFNTASGDLLSASQIAGVLNTAGGELKGFQLAGVGNVQSRGDFKGTQISGVFNTAGLFQGFQLAGVFNRTGDIQGMQIGLVNLAGDVRGNQIGLINISTGYSKGFPLGLINISRDGLHHLSFWADSANMGYAGIQMGTQKMYTLLYGGASLDNPDETAVAGAALGLHFARRSLFMDVDMGVKAFFNPALADQGTYWENRSDEVFPSFRLTAGLRFAEYLSVIGGFTVDAWFPDFMSGSSYPLAAGELAEFYKGDGFSVSYVPRWFLGLRI